MKLKLSLRALLCPFGRNMRKRKEAEHGPSDQKQDNYIIGIILTWFLVCLFTQIKCKGQDMQPLKLGDRVPDISISDIINYPHTSARIGDFKGKLLILDFWATYCSSCLQHFAAADSLNREFPKDLQIMLVNTKSTGDTREKVIRTLKRFGGLSLPSVVGDTVLDRLFRHYSLPHYVWINKAGMLCAITSAEELTRANVRHFLDGGAIPVYQKNDFDPQRPLYMVKDLPIDRLQQYSILLKGKIDGIGGGGLRRIDHTVRGVILHNRSLLSMYQRVLFNKIAGFTDNRVILEVKDPSGLFYADTRMSQADWEREHFYSYELILPAVQFSHIYDCVLEDLNRNTAYTGKFEKRRVKCWILKIARRGNIPVSRGGEYHDYLEDPQDARLLNAGLLDLCLFINKLSGNGVVLDETGFTGNVDLEFHGPVRDIDALQKSLDHYGLKLIYTYRSVEMLVVRDKPSI